MNLRRKPDGTYEGFYGEIEALAYELREGTEERLSHIRQRPGHEQYIQDTNEGWACKVCMAQFPHSAAPHKDQLLRRGLWAK